MLLDGRQLEEVEKYYKACEEAGANEYQIDKSKTAMASMSPYWATQIALKP